MGIAVTTPQREVHFSADPYDLGITLNSGQAFRWNAQGRAWTGVIGKHWVRLHQQEDGIRAETAEPISDSRWLSDYLQVGADLGSILSTFPDDEPMRAAVAAAPGLRLLRQHPWECLASFILSSSKQIVQIRQIISVLSARYGEPVAVPPGEAVACAFPTAMRLTQLEERELRECKMGFRAPYLLAASRKVAAGEIDLDALAAAGCAEARRRLMELPGVGRKVADCVLLFACGFQEAFPVDVWILKALRRLYFPRRHVSLRKLRDFSETHFGPNAGYAQQYLFHYMRTRGSAAPHSGLPETKEIS